jgi:mannose-6-phosphate isomerase-like protein (cupin superfamily)
MILGGNKIKKLNTKIKKFVLGSSKYYFYNYYNLNKNKKIHLPKNLISTIYILDSKKNSILEFNKKKILIKKDTFFYLKKYDNLKIIRGSIKILLVGKKLRNLGKYFIKEIKKNIYKVKKPWGYELWINSLNNEFAFKKIFIKKGFQTSLQYHNFKRETNLIVNGSATLFYKRNKKVSNDNLKKSDLGSINLKKNSVVNVYPKVVHRIKARQDLTLYEVSSPHLKDVIRIHDDTNRSSGHLRNEHPRN